MSTEPTRAPCLGNECRRTDGIVCGDDECDIENGIYDGPHRVARHPAEMILDDIDRILDEHMGRRWRGFRDQADALGVLLHELKANAHVG